MLGVLFLQINQTINVFLRIIVEINSNNMKKIIILMSLLFALSLFTDIAAQSKKARKKEYKIWKKKKKKLDPLDYKRMVEELSSLKGKISSLNSKISDLQQETKTKDNTIKKLRKKLDDSEQRYVFIKEKLEKAEQVKEVVIPSEPTAESMQQAYEGIVFKVQIGAFRNKDLTKYFEDHPNFTGDVDQDGVKKYTLMVFRDYWNADRFKKYLREMGVKDAWIVSYKDGKRVPIKEVLEGAM